MSLCLIPVGGDHPARLELRQQRGTAGRDQGYVIANAPYYQVGIADGGPACVRPDGYELTSGGNLQVQLTIHH